MKYIIIWYIFPFLSSSVFLTNETSYSPLIWKVNMQKTYSESCSTRQTCSICGRTLCRIGLTVLLSRSLSWTPQSRKVSLLLGNKGAGSSLNIRRPLASQFVLKQISEVAWLQCKINTTVFLQNENPLNK